MHAEATFVRSARHTQLHDVLIRCLLAVLLWPVVCTQLPALSPPPPLISPLIVSNDCLLFTDMYQKMRCLDLKSGKILWTQDGQHVEQSRDGTIWNVDSTGHLSRFNDVRNAKSERLCRFTEGLGVPFLESRIVRDFDGTNILMQASTGPVTSLDQCMATEVSLQTRTVNWRYACHRIIAFTRDTVIVQTNTWGGSQANVPGNPGLVALNRRDGQVAWAYPLPPDSWLFSAAVRDGLLFVSHSLQVVCVSMRDGRELARLSSSLDWNWVGAIEGRVVCGSWRQLAIGQNDGSSVPRPPKKWVEPTSERGDFPTDNGSLVTDDLLISASDHGWQSTGWQGAVTAMATSTGKVRWTIPERCNISRVNKGLIYLGGSRQILEVKVKDGTSRIIYRAE